ncbi:MAG: S1 RNA-binding domain-containing protein, partial [Chlorobiales bacterium]|nr:S1 RNA-binding domain-containing protein [Chlorobiales bacterium]
KVVEKIKRIVAVPEVGEVYKGKVKNIQSFGAFIEILPNQDGLLHISEIEWRRLNSFDEVLKIGDEVEVKLIDIDAKTGKELASFKDQEAGGFFGSQDLSGFEGKFPAFVGRIASLSTDFIEKLY